MMKKMKKLLLLSLAILSVILLLTVMTVSASAAATSGTCGTNVTWQYVSSTKTLKLSGAGAMTNYASAYKQPWHAYADEIEKVSISGSVTTIGDYAFSELPALKSVEWGSGLTEIGDYAFYKSYAMTSTDIPEGVKAVGMYAFAYLSDATSLYIPASVTTVGKYAFYGMTGLTELRFNPAEIDFASSVYVFGEIGAESTGVVLKFGANVTHVPEYMFYSNTEKVHNIKTVIFLGNQVRSIGKYAFGQCASYLETLYFADDGYEKGVINLPSGIKTIGTRAFWNCTGFTTLVIPESVTAIDDYAFYGLTALTRLEYNAVAELDFSYTDYTFSEIGADSDGVTVVFGEKVTHIPESIFYSSSEKVYNIKTVIFAGNKVASIGKNAFRYCGKSLTVLGPVGAATGSVILPSSVKTIGSYALCKLEKVNTLVIPEGVTAIGEYAFNGMTGLTRLEYNVVAELDFVAANYLFSEIGASTGGVTLVFGANVTHVPTNMFYSTSSHVNNIKTVIFTGNKVTSIGNNAFRHCGSPLSTVGLSECDAEYGVMVLPESLKTIGNYAFYNVSTIHSVTIPKNVTSIGEYAFAGMTGVTYLSYNVAAELDFGSGSYVFADLGSEASGLTLVFGPKVTHVPANLFYSNSTKVHNVKTVIFQCDSLASVGKNAFRNAASYMNRVVFCGTQEAWNGVSVESGNDRLVAIVSIHATHSWSTAYTIAAATCTERGSVHQKCATCLMERDTTTDALGHNVTKWTTVEEATCLYVGVLEGNCTRCGEKQTKETVALGHAFDHGCDPTCNRCDFVRTSLTHSWESTLTYDDDAHWTACRNKDCEERLNETAHDCNKIVGEPTAEGHVLACACGHTTDLIAHVEQDRSHYCEVCSFRLTDCKDTDNDHYCNVCSIRTSNCEDTNSDHHCNLCGDQLTDCDDKDRDHKCDLCKVVLSTCVDEDKNHNCDLCEAVLSTCVDEDKNHNCDLCEAVLSTCADEDKNHNCDLCEAVLSTCADENSDHKCDLCTATFSSCEDITKDHYCEICGSKLSDCEDADSDHICDLCGYILSECFDEDGDGLCDICSDEYKLVFDNTHHWYGCTCSKPEDAQAHTFDTGVVTLEPTADAEGVKTFTCPECGYSYEQKIDRLPADEGKSKSGCGASVTAGGTMILLCLGAALTVCKRKKD